jgi:hypothetical protein
MNPKKCPSCGNIAKQDARFCPQCGKALTNKPETQTTLPPKEPAPSFARYLVIGSFIAIIHVLILMLVQFITLEEHHVIARQPVVTEPVDDGDREIAMTDIEFNVEDGYVRFPLDDVLRHWIVFIDYIGCIALFSDYRPRRNKSVIKIHLNKSPFSA